MDIALAYMGGVLFSRLQVANAVLGVFGSIPVVMLLTFISFILAAKAAKLESPTAGAARRRYQQLSKTSERLQKAYDLSLPHWEQASKEYQRIIVGAQAAPPRRELDDPKKPGSGDEPPESNGFGPLVAAGLAIALLTVPSLARANEVDKTQSLVFACQQEVSPIPTGNYTSAYCSPTALTC